MQYILQCLLCPIAETGNTKVTLDQILTKERCLIAE
jgi:hypothetical protein